jgi:hypothetical protein
LYSSCLPGFRKKIEAAGIDQLHYRCATGGAKMRQAANRPETRKGNQMLYTIALVLGVMWLLGMVTGYTAGYFIHILLVIAVVMVLLNLIQGRRSV